jgi:hypothetical protein
MLFPGLGIKTKPSHVRPRLLTPHEDEIIPSNGELRSGKQDNTLPGLGIQNEPGIVRPRLLAPHEEEIIPSNGELQSGSKTSLARMRKET